MVNFDNINTTPMDMLIISKIAKRTIKDTGRDKLDVEMDLIVVHFNNPLALNALLNADDFNFHHDVGGISKHLNRETGELGDCFLPRFTL